MWPEVVMLLVLADSPQQTSACPGWQSDQKSILLETGRRAVAAGRLKAALQAYEKVRSCDSADETSRRWLLKLYAWTGRAADIPAVLEELVHLHPHDADLRERLAKAYVASGKPCSSLRLWAWLAEKKNTAPAWRQVAKVALWCSKSQAAIKALERVVRLDPQDWDSTELLGKLLLWNNRPRDAVALLRKASRARPGKPKLRFYLAHALAASGHRTEAARAAESYLTLRPHDTKARFFLAQLCHWDLCWPMSRKLYEAILAEHPNHAKARKYLDLLVRQKGQLVATRPFVFYDSNEVLRVDLPVTVDLAASGRLRLRAEYRHRWYFQPDWHDLDQDGLIGHQDRATAQQDTWWVGSQYAISKNVKLNTQIGMDLLFQRSVAPRARLGIFAVLAGKVYLQAHYAYRTYDNGIDPLFAAIRFQEVSLSVYSEPKPWLACSASGLLDFMSEGNIRYLVFSGLWFLPWRKPFLFKPGLTFGYEHFQKTYSDSWPYYTPRHLAVFAPGLDIGYTFDKARLSLEAGYSLAVTTEGLLSHNPRGKVTWRPWSRVKLAVFYYRFGSKVYGYHAGGLEFRWRF